MNATNYAVLAEQSERHFFRCFECCNVFALEGAPAPRSHAWNGQRMAGALCPTWIRGTRCDCGCTRLEWMGCVQGDALIRAEDRCACDSRCTSARGPKCDCSCCGKNHGTNRVVRVVTRDGIPTIVDVDLDKRLAAVAQWKAEKAAAQARVDALPAVIAMRAGEWINDRAAWDHARDVLAKLRKADQYKTLAARVAALAKVQS